MILCFCVIFNIISYPIVFTFFVMVNKFLRILEKGYEQKNDDIIIKFTSYNIITYIFSSTLGWIVVYYISLFYLENVKY